MDSSILQNFNFAQPGWLWGLCLLPFLWLQYSFFYRQGADSGKIESFADPHLLPHLLIDDAHGKKRKSKLWRSLIAWSLAWMCGILAMAGPRWDYTEVKAFAPTRSLVILLDMSKSMDAQDVKPSRLARARQEIADISREAEAVNIGLIAFDAVPHLITPLTDDRETLERLLPSLDTGLVAVQGGNLAPALDMAGGMLSSEPGRDKHILIVSDGSFEDSDAAILRAERKLADSGARVHVLAAGTKQGAPLPDERGGFIRKNGAPAMFRLEEDRLRRIAADGQGIYLEASYLDNDTSALLAQISAPDTAEKEARGTTRFWEERFYIFLMPAVLLLLPWFRRNAAFPLMIALIVMNARSAQAFEWRDLFLNRAQQGRTALEEKNYDEAVQKFDDSYRRGVAQYRAGKYGEAEKSFEAADRPDIRAAAQYNRGNAQLMSGKIQDAIASYEDILKQNPNHENARHNLEIAKKLLEQQKQEQDQKHDGRNNNQEQQAQQQNRGSQGQDENNPQEQNQQDGQQVQNEQNHGNSSQNSEEQKQDQSRKQESENTIRNDKDQEQSKEKQSAGSDKEPGQQQDQNQQQQEQQEQQAQNGKPQNKKTQGNQRQAQRTQKDINADQWLSRIENDPQSFLKNKFYIESKRQGAREGDNPW